MLAPTPLEPIPIAELRWTLHFPIRTALALISGDMNYLLPTFRKLFFSPEMPKEQANHYMTLMKRESKRVFLDISKIKDPNPLRVSVPALILAAKQDRVPDGINQRLAEAFNAEVHTLPVAHDMMLDPRWQLVADSIIKWIERLKGSTPDMHGSERQP